ncbi:MAG: amidohydrolase family protein [Pseudomonadota bacterium]
MIRVSYLILSALWLVWGSAWAENHDIVINNGRVIDPETGLDAIRNIGIQGDRIVAVTEKRIQGSRTIDASGLVVSPGFIDLHVHGQTNQAHRFQVADGVTTALELESGSYPIREFFENKIGKTLVNFGASASQTAARMTAMEAYRHKLPAFRQLLDKHGLDSPQVRMFVMQELATANYSPVNETEFESMAQALRFELDGGALGIGVPVGYQPGATKLEMFKLFEFAAKHDAVIFTHVRDPGIVGIQEMIANAAATGAPLHIVHINSMALGEIRLGIDLVEGAAQRGLDVSTEIYPYTAGSTSIESALFDEGWQDWMNISYEDLQWVETGERLNAESFAEYRNTGGVVIIHMMQEDWIKAGLQRDSVMVASDGMPYAPGAHPRTAGTFARVLGKYVREEDTIPLRDALAKMTLMPARRLETLAPGAKLKGRIQVGTDADITIFDPQKVIDKATFTGGLATSNGINYVLVNGTLVIDAGRLVADTFPGRPLMGRYD